MLEQIKLTTAQQHAVDSALDYVEGKHKYTLQNAAFFSIGGYAGTGKTTLIKVLVDRLREDGIVTGVCAYTGKAAHVLQQKGVNQATTIHRKIYSWDESTSSFYLKSKSEFPYKALIIDEASMVSLELFEDLCTFGVPIIAIGDLGQLPPISKHDLNLVESPDVLLEDIHRQSEGNQIIRLATSIRQSADFSFLDFDTEANGNVLITNEDILDSMLARCDVIICARNSTRTIVNNDKRKLLKRKSVLDPGERVIFLQNNPNLQVFNGQTATVINLQRRYNDNNILVELEFDDGTLRTMPITTAFVGEKLDWDKTKHYRDFGIVDYAYALTCHKAQGSEWDHVGVIREPMTFNGWDQPRWDYTAITRASKQLTIYSD